MNDTESLCKKIVHLARANLPPLKEGDWTCTFAEKCPPLPAEAPDANQWIASWPGSKPFIDRFYPDSIPEDLPLICTCLLHSPGTAQEAYIVPFLQEADRLMMIGKPIPIRKDMSWAEEGMPRPGRPRLRYSTLEAVVVLFLQSPSSFWVVLGLHHPPFGTGDGGSYVYEVYRVDRPLKKIGLFSNVQEEASAVAEFRSSYGFEVDRHQKVDYSFFRGREGELEIGRDDEIYIEGDPEASLSKSIHLVWNGKQFVPNLPL